MSSILPERTPRERLGLFFLVWTGCYLLFALLLQGFLIVYLGKQEYAQIKTGTLLSEQYVNMLRYLQIAYSIGIFGIPPLIFILLNKLPGWSFVRLNTMPDMRLVFLTVFLVAFSLPVVEWAYGVNKAFHFPAAFQQLEDALKQSQERNEELLFAMLGNGSTYDFIFNLLMVAVVTPIVEELLFRGTLQQLFQKVMNPHVAIWLAGSFFSLIHGDFYGFLPRLLLGVLLGYMFFWSRSLWVPIFAHALHNGVQVVLLFLFQRGVIKTDIETVSIPPYATIGATILLFITLYIFDRVANAQEPNDGERLGESL